MPRGEEVKHLSTPKKQWPSSKSIVLTAIVICVAGEFVWGVQIRLMGSHLANSDPSPILKSKFDVADDGARRLYQIERMYGLHPEQPWLSYINSLGTEV